MSSCLIKYLTSRLGTSNGRISTLPLPFQLKKSNTNATRGAYPSSTILSNTACCSLSTFSGGGNSDGASNSDSNSTNANTPVENSPLAKDKPLQQRQENQRRGNSPFSQAISSTVSASESASGSASTRRIPQRTNHKNGHGNPNGHQQRPRQQQQKQQKVHQNNTNEHRQRQSNQHHRHRPSRNFQYSKKYGTTKTIRPTFLPHPPNHPLTPYIQHSLSSSSSSATSKATSDQNKFKITFLGTGCGNDSTTRNASCTALKIENATFLFDAGEGCNQQLGFSNSLSPGDVHKIFITHLHVDHVGGLITLLLNIKLGIVGSYKTSQKKFRHRGKLNDDDDNDNDHSNDDDGAGDDNDDDLTLEIYGPVGLYNYIAMNLALTFSNIKPLKVIVYELVDEYEHEDENEHENPKQQHINHRRGRKYKKILHADQYPELLYGNKHLQRRTILKNKGTNTWTIQKHNTQKQHDLIRDNKESPGRKNYKYLLIEAAQVTHIPHVQTFGYVVTEPPPMPKIDVEKAIKLGVRPSPKYRLLKIGQCVLNDDGTDMVHPNQVFCSDGDGRGRKVAIIGDTCFVSESMKNISKDCDVLVHEATLIEELKSQARMRGHSTAAMAGRVAKEVNAKVLALNHISGRHELLQGADVLVKSAEGVCSSRGDSPGCPVVAAYDFMELVIPRNGFSFDKQLEQ